MTPNDPARGLVIHKQVLFVAGKSKDTDALLEKADTERNRTETGWREFWEILSVVVIVTETTSWFSGLIEFNFICLQKV